MGSKFSPRSKMDQMVVGDGAQIRFEMKLLELSG